MILTNLAVITRIFSNSFANAFQKDLVKTHSSSFITFMTYFILSILCLYPACCINWAKFDIIFWGFVLFANLLCTLSTVCLVKALKTGDLSILSSINSYKCVVGLLIGIIVLKEIPNVYGFCGLILIVFGSWFVFDTTKEGFSLKFFLRKDVQLRILAMILAGIEAVFLKKIILLSSFDISFILWCFGGLVFSMPLLMFSKSKQKPNFLMQNTLKFLILALCIGAMQFSTNYVFSKINVGLSLALFQLSTIVNLFIGYKLFKETDFIKKFVGIVIMVTGSALILLLN